MSTCLIRYGNIWDVKVDEESITTGFPKLIKVIGDCASRDYVPARTCRIVKEDGGFPHCSRCGALEVVDDVAGPLNYCPMCGAKVVSE